MGAEVMHPESIFPVYSVGLPINIKNTFNPKAEGTRICDGEILATDILGVSAISDTHLITLKNAKNGLYERKINRLTGQGSETLMPDGRKCCGVRGSDVKRAEELLRDEFAQELIHNTIEHIAISEKLSTSSTSSMVNPSNNSVVLYSYTDSCSSEDCSSSTIASSDTPCLSPFRST